MTGFALFRLVLTLCCCPAVQDSPAAGDPMVALVVREGRPLRVSLDARVRVKRVGQPVTATLVEPVYAYDRVVIPAGAKVLGRIDALDPVPTRKRLLGMLQLQFSPPRRVVLRFDRLVLADEREIPLQTRVGPGTADIVLQTAAEPKGKDVVARARQQMTQQAKQAVDAVRRPGRMRRLKEAVVMGLPFHGQYLPEGTVYDAELLAPLEFGLATSTPRAPEGTPAPPESVLSARLVTELDSARTGRGTAIEALLTKPLFSERQELIFPEGTALTGEVTFARPARALRRNGQLRLLFDSVRAPDQGPETLLASLHSAEVARDARLAIDDEGGASVRNPNTRFVAPALALGAAGASLLMEPVSEPGQLEPGVPPGAMEPNSLGTAAGGFSGLGLTGIGLSQVSRSVAVGLGVVGLARSVFGSFLAKGREVSFPAGTRIQVQLAPGPSQQP